MQDGRETKKEIVWLGGSGLRLVAGREHRQTGKPPYQALKAAQHACIRTKWHLRGHTAWKIPGLYGSVHPSKLIS